MTVARSTENSSHTEERKTFFIGLALVFVCALVSRLIFIHSIPQGTYIDELFTLRNTLKVMEEGAPIFGQTALMTEGWVETSNLYLTFNSIIIQLFGATYLSIKLFSVIPGIAACLFFYLAATRMFSPRLAILVSLFLVFSHWHLRLSRYGWDASFLVMTFAAATWLLLASLQNPRRAIFAGLATGLGLYSYILGRLCLLGSGAALGLICLTSRKRQDIARLGWYCLTAAVTVAPLVAYYLSHPHATWVRVKELLIFGHPNPGILFLQNSWAHLLMFFTHGGIYARDNYPGLPMLDAVTGVFLIIGVVECITRRRNAVTMLLFTLLASTLLGGILSKSQEGAPYPYRTCAAIIPVILLCGIGIETAWRWIAGRFEPARSERWMQPAGIVLVTLVAAINGFEYFGLEQRSISSMRLMGVEFRLVGEAIRQTPYPVLLAGPNVMRKITAHALPGEKYYQPNREVPIESFGPELSYIVLLAFGNRYDLHLTMDENLRHGSIGKMAERDVDLNFPLPFAAIFQEADSAMMKHLIDRYPSARVTTKRFSDSKALLNFTLVTVSQ